VSNQGRGLAVAGLVVAVMVGVITLLAWLHPFEPAGRSPLPWPRHDGSGPSQPTDDGQRSTAISPLDAHTPPLQDPDSQDRLPAGAKQIGQPDLERYCQTFGLYVALRYLNTAWGWKCAADTTQGIGQQPGDRDVIVLEACGWQFGAGSVSHYGEYYDSKSWRCYR
jgi:hypothetical protein